MSVFCDVVLLIGKKVVYITASRSMREGLSYHCANHGDIVPSELVVAQPHVYSQQGRHECQRSERPQQPNVNWASIRHRAVSFAPWEKLCHGICGRCQAPALSSWWRSQTECEGRQNGNDDGRTGTAWIDKNGRNWHRLKLVMLEFQ